MLVEYFADEAPNGLRYLRVGGTRQRHFDGTKLEPKKLREKRVVESNLSAAPWNDGVIIFHERNCLAKVYSEPAGQQAVQSNGDAQYVAVPRCTLVAGPIDLTTGGEGGRTPMRKLTL